MDPTPPACPLCGALDDRAPDPLGVYRCPACAALFRPPVRVPIRRAAVTKASKPNSARAVRLSVLAFAVIVVVAIVAGDYKASTSTRIEPPTIDPLDTVRNLELFNPMATVTLDHETHRSQVHDGELFATGLIIATEPSPVQDIALEITARDGSGASLVVHRATVACRRMQPNERCAWMIDAQLPDATAEIQFEAIGRRTLVTVLPQLDLRSDPLRNEGPGELSFDPIANTVSFAAPEHTNVISPWATVTALDAKQRVLAVHETRWRDSLDPGRRHTLRVSVPKPSDPVASYEVRVGGDLLAQ